MSAKTIAAKIANTTGKKKKTKKKTRTPTCADLATQESRLRERRVALEMKNAERRKVVEEKLLAKHEAEVAAVAKRHEKEHAALSVEYGCAPRPRKKASKRKSKAAATTEPSGSRPPRLSPNQPRPEVRSEITRAAGRMDYSERREARITRQAEAAARKTGEADARWKASHLDNIPIGQPILVGHHSERRHRRDIEKALTNSRKAVELYEEADTLKRQAEAGSANRMISSDDPDAIVKLREKLAAAEVDHAALLAVNKLLRATTDRAARREILRANNFSKYDSAFGSQLMGASGIPTTHSSAGIRAIKARLADLEKRSAESIPEDYVRGAFNAAWDADDNRVVLYSPYEAERERREAKTQLLRAAGFVWSPKAKRWQRKANIAAWYAAKAAVDTLAASDDPKALTATDSASGLTVPGGVGGDGTSVTIQTARGSLRTIPARFVLISAESVIPSHDASTFDARGDYPPNVQERRYDVDLGEQAKVIDVAQNMTPGLIANTSTGAIDGTPIVVAGGTPVVLGGNGRTMGAQRHYRSGRGVLKHHLVEQRAQCG